MFVNITCTVHARENITLFLKANSSVRDVCKLVVPDLISVCMRATLPTVRENSFLNRLVLLVDEADKLRRYQQNRTLATFFKLRANIDKLLDIDK